MVSLFGKQSEIFWTARTKGRLRKTRPQSELYSHWLIECVCRAHVKKIQTSVWSKYSNLYSIYWFSDKAITVQAFLLRGILFCFSLVSISFSLSICLSKSLGVRLLLQNQPCGASTLLIKSEKCITLKSLSSSIQFHWDFIIWTTLRRRGTVRCERNTEIYSNIKQTRFISLLLPRCLGPNFPTVSWAHTTYSPSKSPYARSRWGLRSSHLQLQSWCSCPGIQIRRKGERCAAKLWNDKHKR